MFQELEEVKLKPSVFVLMCKELVVAPCIDLFALNRHHQLPRYYSAYADDRAALGHNAIAYVWDPGVCLYANPPWMLIGRVLDKIAKDEGVVGNTSLARSTVVRVAVEVDGAEL